jgi:Zn-dependent M28 family amino/carboxypeptidase
MERQKRGGTLALGRRSSRTFQVLAAVLACALLALVFAPSSEAKKNRKKSDASRLRQAVDSEDIKEHLKDLQDIALANGGNRASGQPGYDASLDYVQDVLDDAGYDTSRQEFDFDAFSEDAPTELEQVAPNQVTYEEATHFFIMEYSGSGDVTANVTNVDLVLPPGPTPSTSNSGCEASDFAGFPAGNIALMQRGTCDFGLKAVNAANAGAAGAIIMNEGQPGRTETLSGTLGDFRPGIPTVGISFELGNQLAATSGLRMRMFTETTITPTTTENLLAETPGGDPDNVVMAGGHLDSVPEGPGINDNGSGTMSLLEIAQQIDRLNIKPNNKIRFAFWGAEESGLRGSNFYVADLTDAEFEDIALYLNFDMVGSPNFVRFVLDGDGSAFGLEGPPGSADIEDSFHDSFGNRRLESEETAFDGRSDYLAFINAGIPAGGLFSGAEVPKTEEQEEIYGGVAGLAYDPCYHQLCDNYFNPSDLALDQFSDAMAQVIADYGRSTDSLEDDESGATLSKKQARSITLRGAHAVR